MQRASSQSPSAKPAFKKAGVVVHGRLTKLKYDEASGADIRIPDKHVLVAPYTQGRFYDAKHVHLTHDTAADGTLQDHWKYYVLPKGGVDPGETLLEGAVREAREETGVDVEKLLGPVNLQRLKHGERIENVDSPGYPGVRIRLADPVPYEHVYYSRASVKTPMVLFNIEVDGIENLRGALKNPKNRDIPMPGRLTEPRVEVTIDEMIAKANTSAKGHAQAYPSFETYLEWLRAGAIPPDGFSINGKERDARHKTMYRLLDGEKGTRFNAEAPAPNKWFRELEQEYAPLNGITSRGDWQAFCHHVPPAEYSKLRKCFAAIKDYAKGRGVIGDDAALIKLDDKDSPLFYYQEGADLVSFERFMSHSLKMAEVNDDYRRAITGDCESLSYFSRAEQVMQSQIAAIAAFAKPREIRRAMDDLTVTLGRFIHGWNSRSPEAQDLRMSDELLRVQSRQQHDHRAWTQRIEQGNNETLLSRFSA